MARQRIALRLLLLVVTAIGIAGMHTLGHPGDAGTGGSVHGAAMPLGEESMAEAVGVAMTVVISGDMHGTGMRMDPFSVCVAILVGGLLALLVALLIRDRRRRMPDSRCPNRARLGRARTAQAFAVGTSARRPVGAADIGASASATTVSS